MEVVALLEVVVAPPVGEVVEAGQIWVAAVAGHLEASLVPALHAAMYFVANWIQLKMDVIGDHSVYWALFDCCNYSAKQI